MLRPLLFCLLLFLTGCLTTPNSGPTTAEGTVLAAHNGQPILHATVWITETKGVTALGGRTIAHGEADELGRFNFSFDANEDYSYSIYAKAPNYSERSQGLVKGKKNASMQLWLFGRGYVKFIIKNDPEPPHSLYKLEIYGGFNPTIDLAYFKGDTILIRSTSGDDSMNVVVQKHQYAAYPPIEERSRIYIPALDTVEFTIIY